MNKTPSILVDTGFPVDANGALTGLETPDIVKTLTVPSVITTNATTINWIPSTTAALLQFNALKLQELNNSLLKGYNKLTTVNMPAVTSISTAQDIAAFGECTSLVTVNMPALATATMGNVNHGVFRGCTALVEITLPALATITTVSGSATGGFFKGCTALTTVNLPVIQSISDPGGQYCATFLGCSALANVTLGSEGHPVTSLSSAIFYGCTQGGLTITVYTSGGAALSGSPWGATNATIVYEEA